MINVRYVTSYWIINITNRLKDALIAILLGFLVRMEIE